MAGDDSAAEKTEEATPKRRQEARDRGQVAISNEFISAIGLIVGAVSFVVGGGQLAQSIAGLLTDTFVSLGPTATGDLDSVQSSNIIEASLMSVVGALLLVMTPAIVISTASGYGQVGFKFAVEAIQFDPSKLDPIKGAGRVFGMRGLFRTGMALAKVLAIGGTVGISAWMQVDAIIELSGLPLLPFLKAAGGVILRIVAPALCVILLLSTIDLMYQRWQHLKDLRMSKQEIKEESKNTEGDPHIKARIRQVQRELATRRMMSDVPEATVVVTNPTHYAVALKYDRTVGVEQGAPRCVAKGVDEVAQKIKEIANAHDVPLFEDVPLARGLYANVEIGDEIPEDFFQAVATVLGYVYRLEDAA